MLLACSNQVTVWDGTRAVSLETSIWRINFLFSLKYVEEMLDLKISG
jgi:hypothetical protein